MTVAELIAKLQTFPPEQRVLVNDDYLWRHPNPEPAKAHHGDDRGAPIDWRDDGDCECCEGGRLIENIIAL